MTLSSCDKLGHYEIVAPAGAGGMGEMYKARDTRLDRIVALKVLTAHSDRFEREARTVASLNHPDICVLHEQCHLQTTSARLPHAITRYERGIFSYRPGEPLTNYALHFDQPPGEAADEKFEIAHQAYRLRRSACFQKSGGRMTCTTCHNPHDAPRGAQAIAHYSTVCQRCHAQETLPRMAAHARGANCIDCHMPKRRTQDVVHVVMTDHFILRPPVRMIRRGGECRPIRSG
jgi:predicted CXXCH cytochrome family protein